MNNLIKELIDAANPGIKEERFDDLLVCPLILMAKWPLKESVICQI